MSHEHHAPAVTEAHANYVAMDGERVTMQILADITECIREDLEELVRDHPDLGGNIKGTLELLAGIEPDLNACPAPLTDDEKLWAARRLLAEAVEDAQELVRSESARQRKAAVAKEAFYMPPDLMYDLVSAATVGLKVDDLEEAYKSVAVALEQYGWNVGPATNPAYIAKRSKPLQQLATMIDKYGGHFLASHILEVLGYALRWCENTSLNFPSPISGKANGQAPEGVLYPRISVEFHAFESWRDIPKEWREPLVKVAEEPAAAEEMCHG